MSEINIETLLKRAAMLEDEKDYAEALSVYNRILDADPDNETAYEGVQNTPYNNRNW